MRILKIERFEITSIPRPNVYLTTSFLFVLRELSFKKGDVIYIRREIDKNWYEGEINATIGLLPANYVQVSVSAFT